MIKTLNLNKKAQDILSNSVSASRVTDWENLIKRPNFEQLLDEEIAKFQQTQAGKTSATVATDEIQNMRAPDTAVDYGLLYGAGVPQVNGGRVVVSDINQLVADKQNTGTQSAPVLSNNALSPEEILLGTGRAGRTFADNLTYGQAARYMGDANLFGGEKAATKAKETIAAKENYTGDWREAQENEMKALRDAIWAMDTDEQTPEQQAIIARYQELIARRDPSSPFATTAFMPRDPLSQKWGNYLLDRGIGGLASSLEGVKNNVIDMAADQTRNGLLADYQAANAYGDIGASIDLIRGGSLSETEQLDTDALSQQLQGYRTTDWAEAAQEKEATYNVKDGTVLKTAGDVVSGAAGMAPSIVSNLVIPGSGMAVMFSSAAGNATTQALEAGADYDTAFTYGVVTGAVEIATEKITGGIPGLNAGWLDNIFDKTISKMTSNALGRYLIKMGANALGEGFEEWMSEAIGQYTVRIYDEAERGRDIGEVWREGRSDRLYAALVGALMSLVMQAPTSTKGKVSAYNTELNQLTVQNGMVDALASEGMTKAEAQQLAAQLIEQGVDPAAWMQPDTQNDQAAIDAGTAQAFQDAFVKQTQQGDQYQDLQVPVATEYTQDIGGAQNGREGQNVAELAGERSAQGEDLRGSAGSVLQVQGDRSGNSVSTDAGGGRATPAAMEGFSRAASEKGQRVIEYNGRNLAYKPYQGEIRAETSETTSILERRGHQPVLTAGDMSSFDLTTGRVVHGSDGLSLGDGTVLINANSKLNPKELAYHESFHAEWREGRHSSAILFNEFNVQCDTNSIEYENLLKAINNAQYQGKLDISNAEHRKSLLSETVAIYAGDMQGGGRFTSEYMPFLNQTPELAQAYEVFLADEGGNTDTTKKNPATSRPEITAQGGITGGLDSFRSEVNNLTSPLNSNLNQNMKGVDAGAVSANQATETTNDTASKAEQTADLRSLIAKMKDHLPEIVSMPPVASITGEEFSKSGRKLTETVGEFFRSIGNKVRRHGLGDIILDVRGIRSDIAHGFGRRKAAAFAAVPKVIENGIEIDYQTNWKDRGYDTYVFAAPIAVGNETNVVGVVVRKSNDNRLYLHEVIDGDGNLIYTKKEEPGAIKTGVTAQDGVTGWPNSSEVETVVSPLNSTINQNADVVNSSGEVTAQQAAVRAAIEDKPVNTSEKSPEQLEKVREMQAEIDKGDVGIIERETTVDDVGAAQALRNPTEGLRG